MPRLPHDHHNALTDRTPLRPSGELTSIREMLRSPQQKVRAAQEQGSDPAKATEAAMPVLAKKTVSERKQHSHSATSADITLQPPDKHTNGDVIGFTPYFTTQFGLPHSPVKGNFWQRKNGTETLTVYSDCKYGLPSGSKPRLLLAWVATWQVRHPNATVIDLGKNVSRFLERELELPRTGRYIKDIRLEIIRLFSATISIVNDDPDSAVYSRKGTQLSEDMVLWGSTGTDGQDSLYPSYIELSTKFRAAILERSVPFDLRALSILTPSSLAMDYYVWLTRVMFSLKKSRLVPWKALHDQFGSQYDWQSKQSRYLFRFHSKKQICERVRLAYPDLRVSFPDDQDGIMLHPSPTPVPHIAPK